MAKKRSGSGSNFGCFIGILIVAALVFGGIFAGLYVLGNGNPFASSDEPIISGVEQINPDVTQIPETTTAITPDTFPDSPTFARILSDVNDARADSGLNSLVLNSRLNRAAAEQAVYNASIYDVTHQDVNGEEVDARVTAQGYTWRNVGENLLSNWSIDGHEVFILWQGSPTHNANMMKPEFTEIGLAYRVTSIGQVYHAMVLARPQ